jgi:hypothetical protein
MKRERNLEVVVVERLASGEPAWVELRHKRNGEMYICTQGRGCLHTLLVMMEMAGLDPDRVTMRK